MRAQTFDEVAELYDRARRGYPEQLFDDLFALSEMSPDESQILEIGCGTGLATRPLARRGCRVVGVEPGANLARIARRNTAEFPRVTVVNQRFEDFDPAGATFDMVFAATSWHWIDPQVRYAKAASVLKPGGVLAFTWGAHAFPSGFDPFFSEIQKAYDAIGQSWDGAWPPPPPEQVQDLSEDIERSGYFEEVRVARHVWTTDFNAEEHVALMSTASDHRLMEPAKREWLFSEMRRLHNTRPDGIVRLVIHPGAALEQNRLRLRATAFDESLLDPDVNHKPAAGDALAIAAVTRMNDQRSVSQLVADSTA